MIDDGKIEIHKTDSDGKYSSCDNCFELSQKCATISVWTHEMTLCPACLKRLADEINLILSCLDS